MSRYITAKYACVISSLVVVGAATATAFRASKQQTSHYQQFTPCISSNLSANTKTTSATSIGSSIAAAFKRRYTNVGTNRVRPAALLSARSSIFAATSILVGSPIAAFGYFAEKETVPYTKRVRHVAWPCERGEEILKTLFEREKKCYGEKVLPQNHPQCVRVNLITRRIVEALHRGIKQDKVWSDERNCDAERKYIEGLKFEVMVVDSPEENAFCIPGGKLMIHTGLLKHFTTDDEIAMIIGHEVAHAVARYSAEILIWHAITFSVSLDLVLGTVAHFGFSPFALIPGLLCCALSHLFLELPLSRRLEIEADYIGLLLIASAGYDPRVGPEVEKKLGMLHESPSSSALEIHCNTHPHTEERARLLAQVLDEALAIYKEVGVHHDSNAAGAHHDS